MYDVFENFYQLDYDMGRNTSDSENNYSTIRLVTIMEQFCRCIVEIQLEKQKKLVPQKIEIDPRLLDDLLENALSGAAGDVKNAIVSMAYSFQNVHAICIEMETFGLLKKHSSLEKKILKLEPLFQERHALVHTVESPMLDSTQIASYRNQIEDVIHEILDKLDMPMYDFDILKGHAFRDIAKHVYLKNAPDIMNVDKLDKILDGGRQETGMPWFSKAKEFHDASVVCFDSALGRFLAIVTRKSFDKFCPKTM